MTETSGSTTESVKLSRRRALQAAIALVGGSVAATQLAPLVHALESEAGYRPRFLELHAFDLLTRVVDLMIPETDTPGAVGAGVHRFVDMMLDDFAADDSRRTMLAALDGIDAAARAETGRAFTALAEHEQFEILAEIDRQAFVEPGSEAAAPYRALKSLVLSGYYSSEIGATVELRFDPVPGSSPGCVPLESIGRAWYKHWGIA